MGMPRKGWTVCQPVGRVLAKSVFIMSTVWPAVMGMVVPVPGPSIDFNANLNIDGLYTAGLFTRNFQTAGLMLQAVLNQYRLGYAIELPLGSDSALNFTTHELTLIISFDAIRGHDMSIHEF